MPFEVGQSAGDYEILSVLGKGGMGRVYQVRNIISNRVEAMKVLLADVAAEAELGDRFISEIRTLARLDHPNIAKFHTAFKVENQLVMVMEFVEGFTLSDRAGRGPIPLDEVLSYITQVLAALSYAHTNGVIHRDIKPSNIMVTSHGIVKLMDFGIAKSNAETLLTRPGTTMGSMLYMSPEQVRGATIDARSDLYSAGVVLYELSAGRRPFEAENTFAILEAQLNTVPKSPLELNPSLPPALNEIIMTALAKEPMRRFQSAEAFRNALESVRGRAGISPAAARPNSASQAQTVTAPQAAGQRSHRGLWMAVGAIVCVCVLVGGAIMLPHFWKSSAASKATAPVQQVAASTPPSSIVPPSSPAASSTAPETPSTAPAAQVDTSSIQAPPTVSAPRTGPTHASPAKPSPRPVSVASSSEAVSTAPPVAQAAPPQDVAPPAGPSQKEVEKVSDDLTKLRSRADSVNDSLNRLRQQQAADGFGVRQDMAASASRMESYLQSADHAFQNQNLESARKNMDRAEQELSTLEKFFGR